MFHISNTVLGLPKHFFFLCLESYKKHNWDYFLKTYLTLIVESEIAADVQLA